MRDARENEELECGTLVNNERECEHRALFLDLMLMIP